MSSLSGSSLHGILQARIPKWVAISFPRRSSQPRDWIQVSCIAGRFFTLWVTKPHHYLFYKSFIHIHFRLSLTATLSLKVREWKWIFISTYFIVWDEASGVRLSVSKSWLHLSTWFAHSSPQIHALWNVENLRLCLMGLLGGISRILTIAHG